MTLDYTKTEVLMAAYEEKKAPNWSIWRSHRPKPDALPVQ